MAIKRISRAFKDISLSFEPHPITKDLQILKNENAIRRSVRNIVETIPTERFFNSILGSDVRGSLFEFVDFGLDSRLHIDYELLEENQIYLKSWEEAVRLVVKKVFPKILKERDNE